MTTYSTSLKLALIADGGEVGLWGQTTNTNLGTLLEQAITGTTSINMADANVTLTSLNGATDQARNQVLILTGTNNAVRDVIPPVVKKTYIVYNNTTGGYSIRVIGASGTGVLVPNGTTSIVYCNGTNFYEAINSNTITGAATISGALSLGGALTYGGVTLSNAATGTGSMVLSASPALTGTPTAPTATPGTNTTQIATTAFVLANGVPSGAIMMWSGSIASIPSGWFLCNGSNGTPDLRDRFIVGAGSTYAVAATGGSANAIVVSHTHTGTTAGAGSHNHRQGDANQGGGSYYGFGDTSGAISTPTNRAGLIAAGPIDGTYLTDTVPNHTHTFTTDTTGSSGTNANLPPYYALAYIMKA